MPQFVVMNSSIMYVLGLPNPDPQVVETSVE
jgi:hypothetical protein